MTLAKTSLAAFAASLALASFALPAQADEFDVKMLNKGEKGVMVFEPDFVRAQPGDTINFIAANPGHNAETMKGMLPEGAEAFKSKTSKDFSVTLDKEGVYGVRCTPHFAMGMVALIVVGDPSSNLEEAKAVKTPGMAKKKFSALFDQAAEHDVAAK
ncbi:pseudoazurin [Rhodopseudomonas julia]|nr:pseudoazurin [Rhodopseudomonas julia]